MMNYVVIQHLALKHKSTLGDSY